MLDRNGTIKRLQDSLKVVNGWCCRTDSLDDPIMNVERAMEDALELLKEQEPVVRCKDCKHQNWVNAETGCIVCKIGRGTNAPDWYCADGERR